MSRALVALIALSSLAVGCDDFEDWSVELESTTSDKGKNKDTSVDLSAMATADDCGFTVGQAVPFRGEEEVFLHDSWAFDRTWVTEPSQPLKLELVQGDNGEYVEGYTENDGYYFYFVPFEPVKPGAEFLLQGTTRDGCTAKLTTFTTGAWGRKHTPPEHTAYLLGRTDWDEGNWNAITEMLFWQAGLPAVWQGEEGDWAFAGWFEGQDVCMPTVPAYGGFHRGALSLRADEVVLGSPSRPMPMYDMTVHGLVSADGQTLERVDLEGLVDLWWVGEAEGLSCDQVLAAYGSTAICTECPDGVASCAYIDTDFYLHEAGAVDATGWGYVSGSDAGEMCL